MQKMMPMHQNFKNFIKISLIPWKFHNLFKKSCQKRKKSKKSDKISIFYKKIAKKWKKMQKSEKTHPQTQKKWKKCQKLHFWTPKKYPKTEFFPPKIGFFGCAKKCTFCTPENWQKTRFLTFFCKNYQKIAFLSKIGVRITI